MKQSKHLSITPTLGLKSLIALFLLASFLASGSWGCSVEKAPIDKVKASLDLEDGMEFQIVKTGGLYENIEHSKGRATVKEEFNLDGK